MKILDRLPIYEAPAIIPVGDEMVQVWQNQAIVWLSLRDALRPFPAILDTGHSHDLSIARKHFDRWVGGELPQIGWTRIGMEKVPQYGTKVFLHRNEPGTRRRSGTHPLHMDQGISVVPDESRAATAAARHAGPHREQAPAPDRRREDAGDAGDQGMVLMLPRAAGLR